jgi:sugar transferase (PEP-CTERM/EpsH1 system associated)
MKILYVCHRFPYPPRRGGKIRPFNMIRHLHQAHEVTVASLARSPGEADEARGIAKHCAGFELDTVRGPVQLARMAVRLPTRVPSSIGYFHSRMLARKIEALLATRKFDLVFVHCSSVAHYVERVRGIPKILDFGDMDSQKWLEYARFKRFPLNCGYWLEGRKLLAEEKRLARRFDFCTATTHLEWETLEGYDTGTPTDWFPNGVDTDYFSPSDQPYDPDLIAFVGRMDYYPNQQCMFEFCANVWPSLCKRRPGLRLAIVGADPAPAVRRLAQLPGVAVTGSVPDVRPWLRRSALTIAPLNIARGTQNKILEAMALGVPVVASELAAKGVDAVPGEHLLTARTAAEYEAAIIRVLDDTDERARLSRAGRERMHTHHAWERSMARLDAIIEQCVNGYGRANAQDEFSTQARDDECVTMIDAPMRIDEPLRADAAANR